MTEFQQAMERVRLHFDKGSRTPYITYRGATPKDQPSLPKDIRFIFQELKNEGVWDGAVPALDPLWEPVE